MGRRKIGLLGPPAPKPRVKSGTKPHGRSAALQTTFSKANRTCKLKSELQQQCAVIVGKLLNAAHSGASGGTVKGLCLAPNISNKRAVYAVVCETLKHSSILRQILHASGFLELHPWVSLGAALVLLYDHLLGQGIKGHGRVERAFLSHADEFMQLQQELLAGCSGATHLSDLLPAGVRAVSDAQRVQPQRYIRCNSQLTTPADVIRQLQQPPTSWSVQHQHTIAKHDIQCEPGMPDVLAVPAGVIVHDHPLVMSGQVVIQGRSSCMPSYALAPEAGSVVMDCCAAPGNKTTHLAAMVGTSGTVIALDKDQARCELLQRNVTRCRATNVQVRHQDFLKLDPDAADLKSVQGILLDPSCSGSGTAHRRMDFLFPCGSKQSESGAVPGLEDVDQFPGPTSNTTQRITALAAFQTRALKHAMKFPNVCRIAYSTCSVYAEENEKVVAACLPAAEAAGFSLENALPFWKRRGLTSTFPWAPKVVRVHPELDGGDGFFVAVFARQ
eukprot:jgi/Ulvmu1/7364/UM036_0024.1